MVPCASDLWPALIGPLVILFVYVARDQGWEWVQRKMLHEALAVVLTPIALALFTWTAYRTRDPLQLVLTALSATFLMREIHFYGARTATYFALAAIAIWAWRWREDLLEPIERGSTRRWLYSALLVYFLSQLMDRRALRFLPHEPAIHVAVEEMLENAAHLLWITTAVVTRWALPAGPRRREREGDEGPSLAGSNDRPGSVQARRPLPGISRRGARRG